MSTSTSSRIGSLNETSLHAALKEWVRAGAPDHDAVAESNVDGYVVDVRLPGELVEIQTGSFAAVRDKLARLVQHHVVRLVHPIAAVNRISRISTSGELKSVRR